MRSGAWVVLHVVIIFGAFLMMHYETPLGFLGVLIGLKALVDLGATFVSKEAPRTPPRWLAALASKKGIDMQIEWTKLIAEQKEREREDEEPLHAG